MSRRSICPTDNGYQGHPSRLLLPGPIPAPPPGGGPGASRPNRPGASCRDGPGDSHGNPFHGLVPQWVPELATPASTRPDVSCCGGSWSPAPIRQGLGTGIRPNASCRGPGRPSKKQASGCPASSDFLRPAGPVSGLLRSKNRRRPVSFGVVRPAGPVRGLLRNGLTHASSRRAPAPRARWRGLTGSERTGVLGSGTLYGSTRPPASCWCWRRAGRASPGRCLGRPGDAAGPGGEKGRGSEP